MEEWSEKVEIDADRWITLEFSRPWPKYVVEWSIRRRFGDGDFPAGAGRVEHMPPRGDETLDDVISTLRAEAVEAAQFTAASTGGDAQSRGGGENRGLISRLFGRRSR